MQAHRACAAPVHCIVDLVSGVLVSRYALSASERRVYAAATRPSTTDTSRLSGTRAAPASPHPAGLETQDEGVADADGERQRGRRRVTFSEHGGGDSGVLDWGDDNADVLAHARVPQASTYARCVLCAKTEALRALLAMQMAPLFASAARRVGIRSASRAPTAASGRTTGSWGPSSATHVCRAIVDQVVGYVLVWVCSCGCVRACVRERTRNRAC